MSRRVSITELHLHTREILEYVANGNAAVIEKRGLPVAEIRPVSRPRRRPRFPDHEAWIQSMPEVPDSGRILEEDRM